MNNLLVISLNEPEHIYSHTVKWFQILLFIVCTQLNGLKYCYLILIIQFDIYNLFVHVTQSRWSAKQTIPLSVLARNQTKGFGLEISPWPEVEGDARRESVGKGAREGSWLGTTDRGSRHQTPERWDQSEEMGSRPVKEDRVKMSRHSSCFEEVSLVTHASVSLHMHKVLHNSPSALELTPSVCLFCSFPPVSSIVFNVAVKKCALPLSEPLVDHRP